MTDIKSKLLNHDIIVGSWITLGHFSIAEIMADAGFDWLCVDLEHSFIDYSELAHLIAVIDRKDCIPFVRVGANNPLIIKRVLDAGARGIILPMINSMKNAKDAVDAVKYPPNGTRGVGLARAQGYGFNFDGYAETVNYETIIIAQIEHIEAVNNLEEILRIEDVDATIIGPYDLSGSIGKPGKFNDPEVHQVLKRYEETSRESGKPMGYHVIEPDYRLVMEKIDAGYTFIAFSLDTLFFGSMCRQQMKELMRKIR